LSLSSGYRQLLIPASAVLLWTGLALRASLDSSLPSGLWLLPLLVHLGCLALLHGSSLLSRLLLATPWLLTGFRQISTQAHSNWGWLASAGQTARHAVSQAATGVTAQSKALALGITDGDVSGLSTDMTSLFKSLSLTHLTAVSGANCAILIGVLILLAKRIGLGRSARTIICCLALAGYLVLVGDQPSVIRAAVMATVTMLAANSGSVSRSTHLLALAVIAVLIINPSYSISLGFALSVFATAGVVLLAPRIGPYLGRWLPEWLAGSVAIAIAAQLCCFPLLVGLQSRPSSASLLANLLAEPAVAPITILGLLAAVLALLPFGLGALSAGFLFWVASLPAAFIIGEAQWLGNTFPSLSMPTGQFGFWFALALLISVALVTATNRGQRRIGAFGVLVAACLFIFGSAGHLPSGSFPGSKWMMVACDVGQGDATVLRSGNEIAVVDVGKQPGDIDGCLRRMGIKRIQILVLTHFDLDHVGGLEGALRGRKVVKALVTQFSDIRPGAQLVSAILRAHHIPTVAVAQGQAGSLGADSAPDRLSWLVLSPHPGGADAATSNEGSVSMFWHSARVNVFTMADLPAVGQNRVMDELSTWWKPEYGSVPTVLKLSHHGSADQDPNFLSWVHPLITTISVGKGNPYGHPTKRALSWLSRFSQSTLRTDLLGSIAIKLTVNGLAWSASGAR